VSGMQVNGQTVLTPATSQHGQAHDATPPATASQDVQTIAGIAEAFLHWVPCQHGSVQLTRPPCELSSLVFGELAGCGSRSHSGVLMLMSTCPLVMLHIVCVLQTACVRVWVFNTLRTISACSPACSPYAVQY
jgi:hypothetical protein